MRRLCVLMTLACLLSMPANALSVVTADYDSYRLEVERLFAEQVDGMTSVTIRYTEGGRSVTTTQAVTVIPKLVSIAGTTPPTKTAYRYGDAFSAAGMVVTATYTDGNSAAVVGYILARVGL